MGQQLKLFLKRGIVFALAAALLWTDTSVTALATSTTSEPIVTVQGSPSPEATGSPSSDGEENFDAEETPDPSEKAADPTSGPEADEEEEEEKSPSPSEESEPSSSPDTDGMEEGEEQAPVPSATPGLEELDERKATLFGDANGILAAPENLELEQDNDHIMLRWTYPNPEVVAKYWVYRAASEDAEEEAWEQVKSIDTPEQSTEQNISFPSDLDMTTGNNAVYYFKVVAEDEAGNKGESAIVTNKDVPMGWCLENTGYKGICFLDENRNKLDQLSLYVGEGKKVAVALIKDNDELVLADQFKAEADEEEDESFNPVEWSILKVSDDSDNLSNDSTGEYVKAVLSSDTLPYEGTMWFQGESATGTEHYFIQTEVRLDSYAKFVLRMPVTVEEDGNDHVAAPEITICDTEEEAYRTARAMMVDREQTWFLVKGGVFDQSTEIGAFSLEGAYDFYEEREGMKPYEGDYLHWTMGNPEKETISFDAWEQEHVELTYNGERYDAYKLCVPFITTRDQEDAVDNKIDELLNQEGGALYSYKDKSDREKVKAIYDYIIGQVSPDDTAMPIYNTAYSALINGVGNCQAYAMLFTRLSREMGIPSKVIMGVDANAYNIVEVDSKWYYIDACANIYLTGADNFKRAEEWACFRDTRFVQNYLNLVEGAGPMPLRTVTVTNSENSEIQVCYSFAEASEYVKGELAENPSADYFLTLDADMEAGNSDLDFESAVMAERVSLDLNGYTLKLCDETEIQLSEIYDSTNQSIGIQTDTGASVRFVGNSDIKVDMNVTNHFVINSGVEVRVRNLTVGKTTELNAGGQLLISGKASLRDIKLVDLANTGNSIEITLLKSEESLQSDMLSVSGKLINETEYAVPLLICKRICTEEGETPAEFASGEVIATVTSSKTDFPESCIAITRSQSFAVTESQSFVEREGNYLKASMNMLRVSFNNSQSGEHIDRIYSSVEKAVEGLSTDFESAKGEYSFVFEADCVLSKDVTIPAFASSALLQTPQWGEEGTGCYTLDLNGHSITFASNTVTVFEGVQIKNSGAGTSKITLSAKDSSLWYLTRGSHSFVDASYNPVIPGSDRALFSNVSINAPNSRVYFHIDSNNVLDNPDGLTYTMEGDITAYRLNIAGNSWKTGKVTVGSLELQNGAYDYPSNTYPKVNTSLECSNLILNSGQASVKAGTKLTVENEITLTNTNVYVESSEAVAGTLKAGTINVKTPYSKGPSIANYGIWNADKLIASDGSILNIGRAYIKNVEKVKNITLSADSIFVCDSMNQVSGGIAELSNGSVFVANDSATLQKLDILKLYVNGKVSAEDAAYVYTGKESKVSLQNIIVEDDSVKLKYGKLDSDTKAMLDEAGDLANSAGKLAKGGNGYPVCDLSAKSLLFTTNNKAFPVEGITLMQKDPFSKYQRVYQLGQNVYVGGEWITIKAQNADGSDSNAQTLKSFIKWTDASAYLTTLSNSAMTYIVEISEDVDTQEALTLPAKAAKVIFRGTETGGDGRIDFCFVGDVKLPLNVTFENMNLIAEVYDKNSNTYVKDIKAATLNGKTLELVNSSAEFSAVSGTTGSKLVVKGTDKDEIALTVANGLSVAELSLNNATIQGGKTVTVTNADMSKALLHASGAVTVKDILSMETSAVDSNGKITLKNLVSCDDKNELSYADNGKNILTITGNISADTGYYGDVEIGSDGTVVNDGSGIAKIRAAAIDISVKSLEGNYNQNVTLLNAEKAMSSWFVVGSVYSPENGNRIQITHLTHKDGKIIKCSGIAQQAVALESCDSGEGEAGVWIYNGGFGTLQEAFSEIERLADVRNKYRITILNDQGEAAVTDGSKALTFPSKAAEVIITGGTKQPGGVTTLSYKGSLSLKCNVTMQNLILNPSTAKAAISLGSCSLSINDCELAEDKTIGKISGSGVAKGSMLLIDSPELEMIDGELSNIAVLKLVDCNLFVKGKITVGELQIGANVLEAEDAVKIDNITNEEGNGALLAPATVSRNRDGEITKIVSKITITGAVRATGKFKIGLTEKTQSGFESILFEEIADDYLLKGIQLAKAQETSTDVIELYPDNANDLEGIITKTGGYLVFFPDADYGAKLVYQSEEEVTTYCLNFADAVAEINSLKTKRDYTIYLTEGATSYEAPATVKMPDKNTVERLTIAGEGDALIEFYYTGGLSFTSDTVLENISLIQMAKTSKGYVDAAGEMYPYPKPVKVSTGGYALTVEGEVNFNTPIELDGVNNGILALTEESVLTTTYGGADNEIYGKISRFADIKIGVSQLTTAKYETKENAYAGGDLQTTKISIEKDASLSVQNNATIKNIYVANGEILVGGKAEFTNVTLSGDYANIMVDKEFNIAGNLTSTTDQAHLGTRRKLDKDIRKCIPYLNVKGNVLLGDADTDRIYVGVYPNLSDESGVNIDEPVKLEEAPSATSQLLTAAKADVRSFKAEPENLLEVNEYSAIDTNGYILKKDKDKILVYYAENVAVALCAGNVSDGRLETAQVLNYYTSLQEAVTEIKGIKDKGAEYTILLLQDIGSTAAPVTLELPAETAKLYIRSVMLADADPDIKSIYYKNNIALKADTEFENVDFAPVKVAKTGTQGAQLNISGGAYNLYLKNISVGAATDVDQTTVQMAVKDISGKGELTLDAADIVIAGNVKDFRNIAVLQNATIAGSLSTTQVTFEHTNLTVNKAVTITNVINNGGTLTYNKDSGHVTNLTIKGKIENAGVPLKLSLRLAENETRADQELAFSGVKVTLDKTKKLANIEKIPLSDFTIEMVKNGTPETGVAENLVKAEKAVYLVNDETDDNTVLMKNDETADSTVFLDLTQAVKEINALNDKNAVYRISIAEEEIRDADITDAKTVSGLKLPDTGKAKRVIIESGAEDSNMKLLACQGAISYKGNLSLDGLIINAESVAVNTLKLVNTKLLTLKNSTVTDLVLEGDSGWDMLNTVSITNVDVSNATLEGDDAKLSYLASKQDKYGKPLLTVKGTVTGENILCKLIASESTNAGNIVYLNKYKDQNLVTASTEAAEKFVAFPFRALAAKAAGAETVEGISLSNWSAYKDRNNYVKNGNLAEMAVEIIDQGNIRTYAKTFEEAVTIIDNIKNLQAEYTMILLDTGNDDIVKTGKDGSYGSMKLPTKAKLVTIKGENQPTIMFIGELKPNCDVVFENVLLTDGKLNKDIFQDSKSIALNMGNYSVTFAQGAGTESTGDGKLLLLCTKVYGKKALTLEGQQLKGSNAGVEIGDLRLKNGASAQAVKDIKVTNLYVEGTASACLDTPAALRITNIIGNGELQLHSYYTKKELTKAATQLTIAGDIQKTGDELKVKVIPYVCRDAKLGTYTTANEEDISVLTVADDKPATFQKLISMTKAAAENIEIDYAAEDGSLQKAEGRLYKYDKGLYLTNREMAVQVYGENNSGENAKIYQAEFYCLEDAVREIDNRADLNMNYEIRLLKNIGFTENALSPVNNMKFPSKAKSVKILPADGAATGNTIVFTGKLTLGCSTTVERVCLAAVKQYKSGNYTYYGPVAYDLNIGGNVFREVDVLQYVPVSGITGYYSTNLVRVIGTLSGSAKGSYYCTNRNDGGAGKLSVASKITGIGTVEFVNSATDNSLGYIVSGGFSGINELIVNENISMEAYSGTIVVNNLLLSSQGMVSTRNLTCSKTLTLDGGTIYAGSDAIGDGKISLNNVILKNRGNMLQGRQDKNGKSLIVIKGAVTADAESSFAREEAITVAVEYNNGSAFAQLHEGMVMLTAQKVSPYWFAPAYSDESDSVMGAYNPDFGLLKSGKEIIYGRNTQEAAEAVLIANPGTSEEQITYFKTFEEAVKEIDMLALNKTGTKEYADFVIELRTDVEIGNQKKDGRYSNLTLPAKTGQLTIEGQGHELRFSGNISLKSDLVLRNIAVCPVKLAGKNVVPAKANWALGKLALFLDNVISTDDEGNTLVGTISGTASWATLKLLGSEATEEEPYVFAADQITGMRTITLSPYTSLEVNKSLTTYNLDFLTQIDREGQETEAARADIRVGGKLTTTLIHKNGIGDAVIIKPVNGEIVITGAEIDTNNDKIKEKYSVCFEEGLTPAQKKLTIEMEGENHPAGTKILTCKFINTEYYQVLAFSDASQNGYGTFVSGTTLLLGQCGVGGETSHAITHSMSEWSVKTAATCETEGTEVRNCMDCLFSESRSIPALKHEYGEWIIDVAPTEEAEGSKHKECQREGCESTLTEKIEKLSPHIHNYTETNRKEATCTMVGSVTYTCSCGDSYSEEIAKKAHIPGEWTIKIAATEEENGLEVKTCSVCGTETDSRAIDKLPHVHNYTIDRKEATCTVDGYEKGTCTCGDTINTVLPAIGHNYQEKEKIAATCDAKGSVTYECANCSDIYTVDLQQLTHEYTPPVTFAPTCTKEGYTSETCKYCGDIKKTNIIEATGHDDGEWTTVLEAELGVPGSKELRCTKCNELLDTEEIPMLTTDGTDSVYYFKNSDGSQEIAIGHYNENEAQEMLALVNNYREENGLDTFLMTNANMNSYTALRAVETSYLWDHARPSGAGCKYAENIAMGNPDGKGNTPSVQEIFDAWVASEGHKNNLDAKRTYNYTGISVFYNRCPVYNSSGEVSRYVYVAYWVETFQ